MNLRIAENAVSSFRNKRSPRFTAADSISNGGGGGILRIGGGTVVVALPQNGIWLHRAVLRQDGFAVFYSKNIIGTLQQIGVILQCGGSGGREGQTLVKLLTQSVLKVVRQQRFCGRYQGTGIAGFCAEAKKITKSAKNLYAAGGKALRRRKGIGKRQLQHQIGAAEKSRLRPEGFMEDGRIAPLDKIAAHQANDGAILTEFGTDGVELLFVTVVKGVIFANNADSFQKYPSFSKKYLFLA